MNKIPLDIIKQLRDRTGASLSECKNVLVEENCNLESAAKNIQGKRTKELEKLEDEREQKRDSKKVAKQASPASMPTEWDGLSFEQTLAKLNEEDLGIEPLKIIKEFGSAEQCRALALANNVPHQLIQQLTKNEAEEVAFAAKVGRKISAKLARLDLHVLTQSLALVDADEGDLGRISRFPNSSLQKAVIANPSVSSKTLEELRAGDNHEVAEMAFKELLSRGADPVSNLYTGGTGYELDVYEISKEQFATILKAEDIHLVDDSTWGLVDQGEFNLSDDSICNPYINNQLLKLTHVDGMGVPLDNDGRAMVTNITSQITQPGKCYAIRAWENKGTWYECAFKGEFQESKLSIKAISVQIGNETEGLVINLFDLEYADALPPVGECSSRGKGVTGYLVDEKGNVTEL